MTKMKLCPLEATEKMIGAGFVADCMIDAPSVVYRCMTADCDTVEVVNLSGQKEVYDLQEMLFNKGVLLTGCELEILARQFDKAGLQIIRKVNNDE